MRSIEQVRVRRPPSMGRPRGGCRVHRACGCRRAPPPHRSPCRRPGIPPPGVRARASGVAMTKIFTSACGQITVPISRPSSTAPGGWAANSRWKSKQRRAHFGDRGHDRGRFAHRWRLQRRLVEGGWIECAQPLSPLLLHRPAAFPRRAAPWRRRDRAAQYRDGAGHNAPASLLPSVPLPDAAGPSMAMITMSYAKSAPSPRISSTKPGKLVAINALSSIRTGSSLASPITSADMAMR